MWHFEPHDPKLFGKAGFVSATLLISSNKISTNTVLCEKYSYSEKLSK
jgi:hypothetical protein